jgi:hypothetical protein
VAAPAELTLNAFDATTTTFLLVTAWPTPNEGDTCCNGRV